jgi:sugar porter (SP) family MFS transporter
MYIAEIAPARLRGRLVAVNQLNVVAGILLTYFSNYLIIQMIGPEVAWRWMLGVEAFPAALFFFLLLFIPYSPRWLVRRGRIDEARAVLKRLGAEDVELQLSEIAASLKEEYGTTRERLFQRRFAFPVFLAIAFAMFNQLSGINALIYYAPRIFAMAGADAADAFLQSVAVGTTNLLFTVVALFIIDRFGRRPLMLVGSVGTAVCLALVALEFYTDMFSGTMVLGGLLSQGAVVWVFLSEIFSNRIRSKGQALGSFTHWFMAAAVSWTFPVVAEASGGHAFAFFAAMMLLQFVFAWRVMPETKGHSLEELEVKLGTGTEELVALEREIHPKVVRPV